MLELKNIHKTFNPGTINEKVALNGLNLSLDDGDFVTVIGGNGAGKSTMLNAVAGTWMVDEGQILIDGDTTGSLKGSEELVTASQKWISKQYKADADEWGVFDANRWDNFYKWLSDNNLVEKRLEKGTGFTNDFIQ